jgi:hypothetical protein
MKSALWNPLETGSRGSSTAATAMPLETALRWCNLK